ncbi:hypothetical protein QQF64_034034 [Cirrhinus molitorella]|uniref:Uncharacterized protein n=1 Tax=Cirrhinus molitorella TaxID=172907 RepID=A0ABR3MVP6_9TELE
MQGFLDVDRTQPLLAPLYQSSQGLYFLDEGHTIRVLLHLPPRESGKSQSGPSSTGSQSEPGLGSPSESGQETVFTLESTRFLIKLMRHVIHKFMQWNQLVVITISHSSPPAFDPAKRLQHTESAHTPGNRRSALCSALAVTYLPKACSTTTRPLQICVFLCWSWRGCEGEDTAEFVKGLINTVLDLPQDMDIKIERAHRALGAKPKDPTAPPRSIIVRFLDYAVKDTILRQAWSQKQCVYPAQIRIYLEAGVKTFPTLMDAALPLWELGIKARVNERDRQEREIWKARWSVQGQGGRGLGTALLADTDLQAFLQKESTVQNK